MCISIHSPLAGRDILKRASFDCRPLFQSTRPSRGETPYTPPYFSICIISIHSPLAGRDFADHQRLVYLPHFNPLAPRGARRTPCLLCAPICNFNPLAPRGARLCWMMMAKRCCQFQSTRPSRGETRTSHLKYISQNDFNPLAPRGARRGVPVRCQMAWAISIHSPLAGRDRHDLVAVAVLDHFNPLAPRGARPNRLYGLSMRLLFQSTRPSRGETDSTVLSAANILISIHSPLAGRDVAGGDVAQFSLNFNPLAPRGARRAACPCTTA